MKVALLQISAGQNLKETEEKGLNYCRLAKEQGADLALFPEMFSNGYRIYDRPLRDWVSEAIPSDSEFILSFQKLAAELEMAVGITLLEACETGPKNTLILFDRYGKQILKYSKVHTCDFDVERNLTAGDDFCTADLDTAEGFVKVGAMICFDREFPESGRILMLKGAELVLVPNACPMEINRLAQLRARAFENMMGIATCNYPGTVPDCNGHSSAFDGVAWLPEQDESRDMCLVEADELEGIRIADFDLRMMREYREREVFGNAYRHPKKYGVLCNTDIQPPFVRPDHRE